VSESQDHDNESGQCAQKHWVLIATKFCLHCGYDGYDGSLEDDENNWTTIVLSSTNNGMKQCTQRNAVGQCPAIPLPQACQHCVIHHVFAHLYLVHILVVSTAAGYSTLKRAFPDAIISTLHHTIAIFIWMHPFHWDSIKIMESWKTPDLARWCSWKKTDQWPEPDKLPASTVHYTSGTVHYTSGTVHYTCGTLHYTSGPVRLTIQLAH